MTKDIEKVREYFNRDLFATQQNNGVIEEVGDNYAKVSCEICPYHRNARGFVMGGAIYTLGDFAFAVATNRPEGDYATVSSSANISYLRPANCKKLIATAKPIKEGKSIAYYEVSIEDENGTQIAYMTLTGVHV